MKFFIVIYRHRHGIDSFPVRTKDDKFPKAEDIIATLDDWEGGTPELDYEDGRGDEWLYIDGPFDFDKIETLKEEV